MHLKKRPIRSTRGVEGAREVGGTRAALQHLALWGLQGSSVGLRVEWNRIGEIPGVWGYMKADHGSQNGLLQAMKRKGSGRWWSPRKSMFIY